MNKDVILVQLQNILNECKTGNLNGARNLENQNIMSVLATELIDKNTLNSTEINIADIILRISNIMYNETSDSILPLDDGIYDRLLEKYKIYCPNYQVGATPLESFQENTQNEFVEKQVMCTYVDDESIDSKLFTRDIKNQTAPIGSKLQTLCYINREPITKRVINTQHKYPELVGTLDKCKCVLNSQAEELGLLDDPTFKIFERDFIHKCFEKEVIYPSESAVKVKVPAEVLIDVVE